MMSSDVKHAAAARGKRALLIGINRYPNLPGHDLSGCVADALALSQLLNERFGFPAADISLLLDQQATRDGILQALDRLKEQSSEDDIVVISYSGHGSQVASEEDDEEEGLDETLVPHDSGRGSHPNRDIRDDEIREYLARLTAKTHHVTVIFDCCHSGSGVRDAFGDKSRGLPADLRALATKAGRSPARSVLPCAGPSRSAPAARELPYVFIAGCRDDERSYEYTEASSQGPCTHGAMSFFLLRELVRAAPSDTIRDVFERASVQVSVARPAQHPQISGNLSSSVFGSESIERVSSLRVRERDKDQIILSGGLIHGITPGSQWAVYGPGTERAGADSPPLGTVEIGAVSAVSAKASVLSEVSPGAITAGARAVEKVRCFSAAPLRIELAESPPEHAAAVADLAAQIGASRHLKLGADGGAAVRIYALAARSGSCPGEPVPQLTDLDAPSFVVIGSAGAMRMAPVPLADPAQRLALVKNLERLAVQRAVLTVENSDPESSLRGKLLIELWTREEGRWEPAARDAQGQYLLVEGERLSISITNNAPMPLYINLLNLGAAGGIDLMYPPPGGNTPLWPGKRLEIGRREGEEIELYLPEGFPFDPVPVGARLVGTEFLKLFATQKEADFTPLLQSGVQGVPGVHRETPEPGSSSAGGDSQPAQILASWLCDDRAGHRDMRVKRTASKEEWITLTCPVRTTRPATS